MHVIPRTNRILKQKRGKLMDVIKASLAESEPESPIHQAAQSLAGDYPWKVKLSKNSFDFNPQMS